jgi:uncharacterized protein (TIGR03066 family)
MTRTLLGCGLMLLAAGGVAGQEKDSPIDPAKLVGKWEPVMPKKDGTALVEFGTGGKLVLKAGVGGKTETWEGTYAVTGQKLKLTVKLGEKTITEELVVLKLTSTALETEDARGKKESLRRLTP